MPVVPAAPTAIEPANTSASTVATSLALSERLPPASTELFERYALTSAGARSPSAVQPIRFCASAAPMAAAAPVVPPAPTESDAAMIVASISEVFVAVSVISPPHSLSRSEEHTSALQSHSDLVCRPLLGKKKHLI